ncbi:hypothetical protein FEM48_Zijuj01G0325600 [Ziziphus jujuba var. spinosa]|uniref:Wall-associated receptor kinase galacturonan-binding domain-containing protein n=1 Tax=Ziziphus jujuba var. spinosa TaxID=714518 RepID=A0A978W6K3_ZIZJJ|nr:hypothetical protein FEM48_Zijuj01G0325600 [Ziziphus jujuba var. spinosa]
MGLERIRKRDEKHRWGSNANLIDLDKIEHLFGDEMPNAYGKQSDQTQSTISFPIPSDFSGSTTLLFLLVAASGDQLDSSGCVRHCGDIDILYPFGLTEKCCLDHNFLIQCDNSSGHPTPLISTNNLTVTRISAERSEMSIQFDVTRDCYTKSGDQIPSNKSVATLTPPNTM